MIQEIQLLLIQNLNVQIHEAELLSISDKGFSKRHRILNISTFPNWLSKSHITKSHLWLLAWEVMMSINHVMIPTQGFWFQTNPLEHELDNHDNCADLLCVL